MELYGNQAMRSASDAHGNAERLQNNKRLGILLEISDFGSSNIRFRAASIHYSQQNLEAFRCRR